MLSLLKIVLLVVAILVILIVVVGYIIIRKIKAFFKKAVDGINSTPPCRVTLAQEAQPELKNAKEFEDWTGQFKQLGFEEVGFFSIPEIGGLTLKAFCHRAENLYGVIYDHQKIPASFDIVCSYEDGSGLTGVNTTYGDNIEGDPKQEKVRINTSSVAEVFDAFSKKLQSKPRKPATPEGFAADFKRGYAESMNWRMKNVGTSKEEIRKQAKKDGMELTEEQLEEAYNEMRDGYVQTLREACVAQYLDDSRLPVVEWEQIRDRVFAIPETLTLKEVIETIEAAMSLDDEQRAELEKIDFGHGTNALEIMDRIIAENIATLGLQKKGEVQEPVRAYLIIQPKSA